MKPESSQQIFEKYSNVKFYDNVSSGSWIIPHRWMDGWTDSWTNKTKLIMAVHNFVNMP